jgi:Right handed beta helix region
MNRCKTKKEVPMRSLRPALVAALGLGFSLLFASSFLAQNRTFVSAQHGSDANPCTVTAPCRSFAKAISTVAAGGEVIALDSGGYGPFTVTKSVSVETPAGVYAGVGVSSGEAIDVSAGASDVVVLRGLTINGAGVSANGITVVMVGGLHVENCVITGFTGGDAAHGNGISFGSSGNLYVNDSIIRANGYAGIYFGSTGLPNLYVVDTIIKASGQAGIWVQPVSGVAIATIDHCRLEGDLHGLISDSGAGTTIRDSISSGNVVGFVGQNGGGLTVENCIASDNSTGISSNSLGIVRVSNTTVTNNDTGLSFASAGKLLSRGNNTVEDNTTDGTFSSTFSAK